MHLVSIQVLQDKLLLSNYCRHNIIYDCVYSTDMTQGTAKI